MEKDDARTLSPAEQHERRRPVIRAHKRGRTRAEMAREGGLSPTAVTTIVARAEVEGRVSLAPRTRGRRSGEDRALTVEQEHTIRQTLCDTRPAQRTMDGALWSRAAVMHLIARACGGTRQVRSVGNYVARGGWTPQQPIRRADEPSPAAVNTWLEESDPLIAERAKTDGAEIHWGDETALVNADVRGRSDAPQGHTPVTRAVGGTREP